MKNQIEIQSSKITSNQQWAADPSLILVTLTAELFAKAEKCHAFLVENMVESMNGLNSLSYEFYEIVECLDADDDRKIAEGISNENGDKFAVFNPEYVLEGCDLCVERDGMLKGIFLFSYTDDRLTVDLGLIDELRLMFAE